ncbi:2-oxoglutarate dehydrogenase complex dihydrolipoyllysine-residue succinyltransferase [Lederbergia galactosidilytica]|uniref:Dihydrolipoyllysine-residue succinyltransferase component of 2-oxoglutarate dehydrogenase complex n=1 Tax=Lederbergia galactosidilytica TaxID=217031 RepID=A0A0Q9Y4P5_9BACI|nr:2-oxoglutarate dehydrogenase complex dihydrolipoyllysine-residue succinyltransferase [Lederbergia galactosidilytica]KRG10584.1 dihydrolipoamide succinyltransferase [Lederbergia galactosidilytica]OAK72222.1 dihydrolipoamide succinyltransferase [Lederbergia galactosidilytica]
MAEIKVPELAESITEGTIAQWLKQPGDHVDKGEYIVELETDKVNLEVISEEEGIVKELKATEGDTVQVGEVIAIVEAGGEKSNNDEAPANTQVKDKSQEEQKAEDVSEKVTEEKKERPIASPAARRLAREKGIDLSQVPTVDPMGRVRKQDVSSYSDQPKQESAPVQKPSPSVVPEDGKPVERVRLSRRRQTIAKRLLEVKQNTAMLTTFNEIDMTAVMDLRKRKKDNFVKEHDVRLGFMSFFTKAVVAALKKYPAVNSELDGDELIMKNFYDIGVAVSTNEGLVVPVIRDCDRKNFAEIESDILAVANKARDNKLTLSDLSGGTFTITNGGVFGSLLSTPILNGTQVGILGMHTIQTRPVAIDAERMENRPMMYVALSYDHRVIDGKEAVGFLVTIKKLLENPEDLLLEG